MKLKIKVIPGSSKDCIMGWLGDAVKVKIKAAAENGKANAAVEKFLAKCLKIPIKNIAISTGFTQAHKTIEIDGLDEKVVFEKLGL